MAKDRWVKVGQHTAGGKKISTTVKSKDTGKDTVLLTQHGKCAKYQAELQDGVAYTNSGAPKKDKNGNPKKLTRGQRGYRQGYVNALGESAAIHKSVKAKRAASRKKGGNK